MSLSKFKIKKGTNLDPQSSGSNSVTGDLEVLQSDGKLHYHNGSSDSPLVAEAHAATLTNKIIDADLNTITNIENADIKSGAAIDATKIADGSVTSTEFQYLGGVTGDLQVQLNAKASNSDLSAHTSASSGVHGVTGSVVGTSDSQALTNKTINADLNTISNIDNADIKVGAAIDAAKIADGSVSSTEFQYLANVSGDLQTQLNSKASESSLTAHTGASSGVHGVTGSVVGTTDTQILTNKDIDGGTASNSNRITLPKASKATLDALTRKEGTIVYASDEDKVYVDDGSNLIGVGSGQGGINYILNPDAETSTTGWATYADAAGVAPVDGTGGSPNVTLTRNTSSPLLGDADFLFTKDAANRQGQGFSYDFTIDNAFKSNTLTVSFNYDTSANYVDGDMRVYVYDVTNATLIELSTRDLAASTIAGQYIGTFQASATSTSYRLIGHISSTNASSYTVNFDNVSVGPELQYAGAGIITPWQSYTPSFTGFGTPTGVSFFYRRVGQNLQIRGKFTAGTATSTEARVSLPSGLTIASTVPTIAVVGLGVVNANSANVWTILAEPSVTYTTMGLQGGSNAGLTKLNGSSVLSATTISYDANIPIEGWESGIVDATGYYNQEVSFSVTQNGVSQTGINPNNSNVKITWAATDFDTTNSFDLTNDRFVAPVSGKYQFDATVAITGTNVLANIYQVILFKNGSQIKGGEYDNAATGTTFSRSVSVTLNLVKGDFIEVYLYGAGNNSASTISTNASTLQTHFTGFKINTVLSGKSSNEVSFAANKNGSNGNAGTNNSAVQITFSTEEFDVGNCFSSNAFTVPAGGAGNYTFFGQISVASTNVLNNSYQAVIWKNNNFIRGGATVTPAANTAFIANVYTTLALVDGDTVDLRIFGAGNNSVSVLTINGATSGTFFTGFKIN